MKKIAGIIGNALSDIKPSILNLMPEKSYQCLICKDQGLVVNGESATPCKCRKQKKALQKFEAFGDALQKASFTNFDLKYYSEVGFEDDAANEKASAVIALRSAKEFVSDLTSGKKTKGLMYSGNVGSGKTHLAAAITNTLRTVGIDVLFAVVPDLLDEMRYSYKSDEINESDIMDSAKNAKVLILDDLGAHNYTEWSRNKLFSIINHRLTHYLPTVITTNLGMPDLEEYLGERTTSRIIELCKIGRLNVQKDIRFQKNINR